MFTKASQVERLCCHWNVQCLAVLRFSLHVWIWRTTLNRELHSIQNDAVLRNLFYLNSNLQQQNALTKFIGIDICECAFRIQNLSIWLAICACFVMQHAYKESNWDLWCDSVRIGFWAFEQFTAAYVFAKFGLWIRIRYQKYHHVFSFLTSIEILLIIKSLLKSHFLRHIA